MITIGTRNGRVAMLNHYLFDRLSAENQTENLMVARIGEVVMDCLTKYAISRTNAKIKADKAKKKLQVDIDAVKDGINDIKIEEQRRLILKEELVVLEDKIIPIAQKLEANMKEAFETKITLDFEDEDFTFLMEELDFTIFQKTDRMGESGVTGAKDNLHVSLGIDDLNRAARKLPVVDACLESPIEETGEKFPESTVEEVVQTLLTDDEVAKDSE